MTGHEEGRGAQLGRLLVINADRLGALVRKGHDPQTMAPYYNPFGVFADYRVLDTYNEAPFDGVRLLELPVSRELSAWRDTILNVWAQQKLEADTLRRFFPGVPQEWLDAVRAYAPDCIRASDPPWAGFLGVEMGKALNVPVLVSVHNTMGICAETVRNATCVMSVSEAVAAECISQGADPARVITVNNRVDRVRFSPDGEVATGPQGDPKLLCIAREHPQKNLDRLLEACAAAHAKLPGLKLVHLGASQRDWSRWPFVTHFDSVPNAEVAAWMRWADALLMPSLWEGFGMALAEAQACGVPCITSDRAPMNEIVTDRWDGLLVNPEDVADIARAISEVADPAVRARLAAPARTSSERFDPAVVQQREAALYRSVLRPERPLVSIVLPTYKRERLIEAAVRNVLAQDYPNFELIVVNDGSPDRTQEILDRLATELNDKRLQVLRRENGGLPNALNTGFAAARGELWTWTSDDNAYRPGAISALVRELQLNPSAGLVYADMQITDQHGKTRRFVAGPPERIEENCCVGGCFMYRASVARLVGQYDPHFTLVEDYDYWLRMRKHTTFVWLPRVLYEYGDEPDSLTRRRFVGVREKHLELMEREHGTRADWHDRKFHQLCLYSAMSKQHGLTGAAVSAAWRAVRQKPGSPAGWWALLRALTPRVILNLTRRLRGLNAG